MNFLTTAFGILFMVGFLYGAGQAMREDSATKVARYKRMANDAAQQAEMSAAATEAAKETQEAGMGVSIPSRARRGTHR